MTWRRILVATDFSKTARVAQRSAELLARESGAGLTLAHVVDFPAASYAFDSELRQTWIEQARKRLEAAAVRSRAGGVAVRGTELRVGKPWFEVLEIAREVGADLICIGNSGHSRFERLLLGSTAENVIRHAEVPVLVTRSRPLGRLQRVLVPVDFDEGSRRALALAAKGLPGRARMEAFHAVSPIAVMEPWFPVEPPSEAEVRRDLRAFLASSGAKDARTSVTLSADPGQAILRRARSWKADVIVISTHGRGGLAHVLLGSVAERVARYADRPVLVLPPPGRAAPESPAATRSAPPARPRRPERQKGGRKRPPATRTRPRGRAARGPWSGQAHTGRGPA